MTYTDGISNQNLKQNKKKVTILEDECRRNNFK